MNRALAVLGCLVALAAPACFDPGVSPVNYEAVEEGMTPGQVESILGPPTRKGGEIDEGKVDPTVVTHVWEAEGKRITVTFLRGEVQGKTKSGL